jgi:galactokinase
MAIDRHVTVAFRPRSDTWVRVWSEGYGEFAFDFGQHIDPGAPGSWTNYPKAAVRAVLSRWPVRRGIEAAIVSDLPPAAGLSSSSAVLTGITIALLRSNGITPELSELMTVLPEGEHFVGTRGGGMDHAVILGAEIGSALRVQFDPFAITALRIPDDWMFLVAHSLTQAEKSGAAREEYNARKAAGMRALAELGLPSFPAALTRYSLGTLTTLAARLPDAEYRAMLHVTTEAIRVEQACNALQNGDFLDFGRLLVASHASLRDQLRVSNQALDGLVAAAIEAGAAGARLTGAGFGGCVIILCEMQRVNPIRERLTSTFYSRLPNFVPEQHLFTAVPDAGALNA